MTTAVIIFANLTAIFLVFLTYAAGLTRRRPERLQCEATQLARLILRDIQWPYHKQLEEAEFKSSSYQYNRAMMPYLLDESRRILQASRDLRTLALFGVFLLLYGLVRAKAEIKPNRDDLRLLIGTEILLARR